MVPLSLFRQKRMAILTIHLLLLQILCPVWLWSNSSEDPGLGKTPIKQLTDRFLRNWKQSSDKLSPEEMEKIIESSDSETFKGDPKLRAEQSSIVRPIKQIALEVLDGEVGIVKSFLAFQATEFLGNSLTQTSASLNLIKARKILDLMNPRELRSFNRALKRLHLPEGIRSIASKMSPGLKSLLKSETKFAAMGLIGALISMGIYDGLDLSTVKDRVLALDPMTTKSTVREGLLPGLLSASASRHFDAFFANRFDLFYDKMISSTSFGEKILKRIELRADSIGAKIFRAGREAGIKPSGESLSKKLGLVGVGEGTKFALKDFLRTVSTGVAFGLVANIVIDTVSEGVMGYNNTALIGANRNKKTVRPEFNTYLFQKTGNSLKDALNERRFVLKDLFDYYGRHPVTEFVSTVTGFTGAYVGSVVAGAILVGGGLPTMIGGVMVASLFGGIGSYLGYWATNKFERSEGMRGLRRGLAQNRLRKVIREMSIVSRQSWNEDRISQVAKDRAKDMDKLESRGQAYSRIFLVADLQTVQLYKKNDFIFMQNTKEMGESFDMQAHIRYDLIDLDGDQGNWDMMENKIFNVGNIQRNNGARVIFLSDDDNVTLEEGSLISEAQTNFRVLSNGLVMTKSDYNKEDWVIKGQNVNTDIFLRHRKLRFTWDDSKSVYSEVLRGERSIDASPLEGLLASFPSMEETSGMKRLLSRLKEMMHESSAKALENLEALDPEDEHAYFEQLGSLGASDAFMENIKGMQFDEWKNLFLGKIQRGSKQRHIHLLNLVQNQSLKDLKNSLREEVDRPQSATIWDNFHNILNPMTLPIEFLK